MEENETRAWLRIGRAGKLGLSGLMVLLKQVGPPEEILSCDVASLARLVGAGAAEELKALASGARDDEIGPALAWLGAVPDAGLLPLTAPGYPRMLLQTGAPPALLFVRGRTEALSRPVIALLGEARQSEEERLTAEDFGAVLARKGLTLAAAVESGASESALLAASGVPGGHALAVLASGPDRAYPARLYALQRRVCETGLLVSAAYPGESASEASIAGRDELLLGLSLGVLVLTAQRNSGILRRARRSAELGREVFAVPGSIHNPNARGAHRLIREGAKLVESCGDILEEIRIDA